METVEIVVNQKYYHLEHYIIVKRSDKNKFRWLVLDDKNNLISKSTKVGESDTPESAYSKAVNYIEELG